MEYHPNARLLAEAMRVRREELGLNQDDLVRHGGPSQVTVGAYEAGRIPVKFQRATLEKLDRALRWVRGSAAAVLSNRATPAEDEEAMGNAALAEWGTLTSDQDRAMLKEVQSGLDDLLGKIIEIRTQMEELTVDPELRNRSVSLQADVAMQLLGLQRHLDGRKED